MIHIFTDSRLQRNSLFLVRPMSYYGGPGNRALTFALTLHPSHVVFTVTVVVCVSESIYIENPSVYISLTLQDHHAGQYI